MLMANDNCVIIRDISIQAVMKDQKQSPLQTITAFTCLRDDHIAINFKIRLLCALGLSIFLYAREIWTLTAELQRRIKTLEMNFYHSNQLIT
ncbi:hypothetical protein PoB_003266100 [Plakobranchus ocellatus]|uniref:Uncharacterized protein n=1 Tax=Plakobranchus ocellatus TaxID=259542 RepID=A0AAV4ACQ9_9GAST|nr:hypothetical protein PoB_003266100 [Plakobranchus ocellatus]